MVWAQSSTQRKLFQIKYDQIPAAILVSWNIKAAEAKETYQSPIPSRLAISFICRRVTLSTRSATHSNQIRHGMSWVISQDELDRNGDIMIPYQSFLHSHGRAVALIHRTWKRPFHRCSLKEALDEGLSAASRCRTRNMHTAKSWTNPETCMYTKICVCINA